ncbi:hypothetical protein [Streptomyces sp. NBC_01264]|uniref:hypothetical protein n=1 Tax=Streptomyces sp. NBC_01264 TaxID=2903804 RepID=UPI00224D6752|nr:hypothetical protein [Streptomyces sp. NBC_01264]MCX4778173.1 hypothetical protein [Streptomyces sp. NBC_01264]
MKHWQLWIDGLDYTDDCDVLDVSTPRLVYEVPHDRRWTTRVLGPQGFTIVLTNPSERLRKLVDDGVIVHDVKVTVSGHSLSNPTQFHMEWVERSQVRKMFGCLASNADSEAKWADESQLTDA